MKNKKVTNESRLQTGCLCLTSLLLVCLFLVLPLTAYTQVSDTKRNVDFNRNLREVPNIFHNENDSIKRGQRLPPFEGHRDPSSPYILPFDGQQNQNIRMEFSLEWTEYMIHLAADSAPLEIILPGHILSNENICWVLSSIEPRSNQPLCLYFIHDVFNREGEEYGINIPLAWDISLDCGEYRAMTVNRDHSRSFIFPAGSHAFNLRISGNPSLQSDGYYQLRLSQRMVPQL